MKKKQQGMSLVEIMVWGSAIAVFLAAGQRVLSSKLKANQSHALVQQKDALRKSIRQLTNCGLTATSNTPSLASCTTGTSVQIMSDTNPLVSNTLVGIPFTADGNTYLKATCVNSLGYVVSAVELLPGKIPQLSGSTWTNPPSDYAMDPGSGLRRNWNHPGSELFTTRGGGRLLCQNGGGGPLAALPTPTAPGVTPLNECEALSLKWSFPAGSASTAATCDPLAQGCDYYDYALSHTLRGQCPAAHPTVISIHGKAGCGNDAGAGTITVDGAGHATGGWCNGSFSSFRKDHPSFNQSSTDIYTACVGAGADQQNTCEMTCCSF